MIVLFITCVPIALIAMSIYYFGTGQMEREIHRTHRAHFMQVKERIENELSLLEQTISRWAYHPRFNEGLRNTDLSYYFETAREISQSLLVMNGTHPLVKQVRFYFADKGITVSTDEGVVKMSGEEIREMNEWLDRKPSLFWTYRYRDQGQGDKEPGRLDDQEGADRDDGKAEPSMDHGKKGPGSLYTQEGYDQEGLSRDQGHDGPDEIVLLHKIPVASHQPYGALAIALDKKQLNRLIGELHTEGEGSAFILSPDNQWITTGRDDPVLPDSLEVALRKEISGRKDGAESFSFRWQGDEYSISMGEFAKLGWRYVSATPMSQLTRPVVIMFRFIFGFSLIGLFIAVLLALDASRRIYRPIQRLFQLFQEDKPVWQAGKDEMEWVEQKWKRLTREREILHERWERHLPVLREGFLFQLAHGQFLSRSEADLRELMKQYGWEPDGKAFAVLMIQLAGISNQNNSFLESDQPLVTFAAENIVKELAEKNGMEAKVIHFQDLSIGVLTLFPVSKPQQQLKSELIHFSRQAMDTLTSILRVQVTVVLGKPVCQIKQVSQSFEEAYQALCFRSLQAASEIIDLEVLLSAQRPVFDYPIDEENNIIRELKMGSEEGAVKGVERFLQHVRSKAGKEYLVQQCAIQLLAGILRMVSQSGVVLPSSCEGVNVYKELGELRETGDMLDWFRRRIIRPYIREVSETFNLQMKTKVEEILSAIHEHYRQDLSLDSFAYEYGINPYVLSKWFKKITGMNFIDYLTNLRLDKSKQFLTESHLKIQEIAEQVGYQPSYFIRLFKKHVGMTPGQYRELYAKQRGQKCPIAGNHPSP